MRYDDEYDEQQNREGWGPTVFWSVIASALLLMIYGIVMHAAGGQ